MNLEKPGFVRMEPIPESKENRRVEIYCRKREQNPTVELGHLLNDTTEEEIYLKKREKHVSNVAAIRELEKKDPENFNIGWGSKKWKKLTEMPHYTPKEQKLPEKQGSEEQENGPKPNHGLNLIPASLKQNRYNNGTPSGSNQNPFPLR